MRRRMLDPNFFTDPDIVASLDAYGRLLYQGIWCVADDSGCLELNPLLLKMKVLPGDQAVSTDDIQGYIDTLIKLEKIITYKVAGKVYGWIKNFHKHQTLNKPSAPTVPLPSWIIWHGEDEFSKRHEYYYEIIEDRIVQDMSRTEEGHGQDISSPEEKRKEVKLSEVNNNLCPDSESSPDPSREVDLESEPETENSQPKYPEDSKPYRAACYLRRKILENNKRARVPDEIPADMEDWAIDMERLNRLGPVGAKEEERKGYSWEEIKELIYWCQEDDFWKANILSAGKLREKVVTLESQMKTRSSPRKQDTSKAERIQRRLERAREKDKRRNIS